MKKWLLWVSLFILLVMVVFVGVFADRYFVPMVIQNETGDKRLKASWLLTNLFIIKEGYSGKVKKLVVRYTLEKQGDRHQPTLAQFHSIDILHIAACICFI
jgi:hypothetical protein